MRPTAVLGTSHLMHATSTPGNHTVVSSTLVLVCYQKTFSLLRATFSLLLSGPSL